MLGGIAVRYLFGWLISLLQSLLNLLATPPWRTGNSICRKDNNAAGDGKPSPVLSCGYPAGCSPHQNYLLLWRNNQVADFADYPLIKIEDLLIPKREASCERKKNCEANEKEGVWNTDYFEMLQNSYCQRMSQINSDTVHSEVWNDRFLCRHNWDEAKHTQKTSDQQNRT